LSPTKDRRIRSCRFGVRQPGGGVLLLDADFTVVDSPELVDALRKLTLRYQRAMAASQQATD
jgi:hypothetical protein